MNATKTNTAKSLFLEAVADFEPNDWPAFLDQRCHGDAGLRSEIEALLEAHATPDSLLDAEDTDATREWEPLAEVPGAEIGPYKLLQQIGEGGFGVVYMAEQTKPVRRKVALKVIKPGMDSKEVIARFEAERQALALMDHPHVARVLDAGATAAGRPFFVMELVKGIPLTDYCDEEKMTARERLELFNDVCRAVQHAHQKGIIHRDLKPSNVMVTLSDGKPICKVIDFGIAKALSQQLTEKTLFTAYGQMVGTPLYMSPEQASLSMNDVDTRSDVYSLGVLLYELLTGMTPFDKATLKNADFDELRRIIREDEPPRPSARISTLKAQELSAVSDKRRIDPRKLGRTLRGELDWIVMKALEKDRNRRYESASAFAADIERYRKDEPVEARSPSLAYRLRKFSRRNLSSLILAVVVSMFFLTIAGGVGWSVRKRQVEQSRLVTQVEFVLDEADHFISRKRWNEAISAVKRAEALIAAGILDVETCQRVERVAKRLRLVESLDSAMYHYMQANSTSFDFTSADRAFAAAFREFGTEIDELSPEQAGTALRTDSSINIAVAAGIDKWAQVKREADDDRWFHLLSISMLIDRDPLRNRLRSLSKEKLTEAIRDELIQLCGSPRRLQQPVETLWLLALTLRRAGLNEKEIEVLRNAQHRHPGDFMINFELAHALTRLHEHSDAVRFYSVALGLRPGNSAVWNNLGGCLWDLQQFDAAADCFREAVSRNDQNAHAHNNYAIALVQNGKLDEGIRHYRRSIELTPKYYGAYYNLGRAFAHQKKFGNAMIAFRKAVELNPEYADAHKELAQALYQCGAIDEAIGSFRTAISLNPRDPVSHNNLGNSLSRIGKFADALRFYRKAVSLAPGYATAHYNVGNSLFRRGDISDAADAYRKAIECDANDVKFHYSLGLALQHTGKLTNASESYRKAIALDPGFYEANVNLGNILLSEDQTDEAVRCFRRAIQRDSDRAIAYRRLGHALSRQGEFESALAAFRRATNIGPNDPYGHNALAWFLANCASPQFRDPDQSVSHAQKAVRLAPDHPPFWNTVGVARYRAGGWNSAAKALQKYIELSNGGNNSSWLFLAMANWKLGERSKARQYYDKAIAEMQNNKTHSEELKRFHAEASALLKGPVRAKKPNRTQRD